MVQTITRKWHATKIFQRPKRISDVYALDRSVIILMIDRWALNAVYLLVELCMNDTHYHIVKLARSWRFLGDIFSGKSCAVPKVPLIGDTLRTPWLKSPPPLSIPYGYLTTMGNDRFWDGIRWLRRSTLTNNRKWPFENITYLLNTYTAF